MRDLTPEASAVGLAAFWLEKAAHAPRRLSAEALYASAGWHAGLRAYTAAQALGEVRLWVALAGLEVPGSIGARHQSTLEEVVKPQFSGYRLLDSRGVVDCGAVFEDHRQKPFEELPSVQRTRPVLPLGRVVATPSALAALKEAGQGGEEYLRRHSCGDWGQVDEHGWKANDQALREQQRVLFSYQLPTYETLWVVTEWDRSVTTLLLPQEY